MSYTGPNFVNDGPPAINAENLNGMVDELERCSARGDELKNDLAHSMFDAYLTMYDLKNTLFWEQGTIASDGSISSAHAASNVYTKDIFYAPIRFALGARQALFVAKYLNGTFVSREKITSGTIEPDGTTFNGYRIMLTYGDNTKTLAEMIDLLIELKSYGLLDYEAEKEKIEFTKNGLAHSMFDAYLTMYDLKNTLFWRQGTIASDGTISSDHALSNIYTQDIFYAPIKITLGARQTAFVAKYKDGTFVSREQVTNGKVEPDGTTFNGYRIMLAYNNDTKSLAEMISILIEMKSYGLLDYEAVNEKIETTKNGATFTWNEGVINNNGTINPTGTSDNYYCDIIKKSAYTNIDISCKNGFQFSICEYTDSGAFISRSEWYRNNSGVVRVTGKNIAVNIACIGTGTGRTINEMLINYTIDVASISAKYATSVAEHAKKSIDFLNKTYAGANPNKIAHYSVDDTYAVLKDLIDNANTYSSIFDNTTLATLKTIHENTGMCITLNTFNSVSTVPDYSIENVPEKEAFQTEFQANKNWLKFAFHAESDISDYSTDTGISTAYDTFVTSIYKLTGDYDCIDRFTRLGFFGGTLANVMLIKNKPYGVKGLLCADETNRDSYYLDTEQNLTVQTKGMCIDIENEMIFLKTITRNLGDEATAEINGNVCYQKYVEVFSHESGSTWLTKCNTMCTWLKDQGYVFAFPSLIMA